MARGLKLTTEADKNSYAGLVVSSSLRPDSQGTGRIFYRLKIRAFKGSVHTEPPRDT